MSPFIQLRAPEALYGTTGASTRATLRVAPCPTACAACSPLAAAFKWGRVAVPGHGERFEPSNYLVGNAGVLARERSPFQDGLDRLSHSQPRATEWRVERPDPLCDQPIHHHGRFISSQVVPNQQQ